jgi:predicted tellurium resistance membrane protein TerC
MTLVADGLGLHIPKGYIYFAMAFSIFVEMINLRIRKKEAEPSKLPRTKAGKAGVKPIFLA